MYKILLLIISLIVGYLLINIKHVSYKIYKKPIRSIDFVHIEPLKLSTVNPIIEVNGNKVVLVRSNYVLNNIDSSINRQTQKPTFKYQIKLLSVLEDKLTTYSNPGSNILVLGFGMGGLSLPMIKMESIVKIDNVDLDYSMFRIYKTLFPQHSPKMRFYAYEVSKFLQHITCKYDFIIDDVFDKCNKIKLNLQLIKSRLKSGGCYLVNIFNKSRMDPEFNFETIFSNVKYIHVDGNLIVVCT